MSHHQPNRPRLVLNDKAGPGRVSMDLGHFLDLAWFIASDLERLEVAYADWRTESSARPGLQELRRKVASGPFKQVPPDG